MRPEKNHIIDEIKSRVDKTPYVLLTDYTGMQVPQLNELRNRLTGAKAEYRVVKNNLLRRALQGSNLPTSRASCTGSRLLSSARATSAPPRRSSRTSPPSSRSRSSRSASSTRPS